jgi:quinol monooxygenase YgiN
MIIQIVKASIKPEARDRWLEMIRWNAPETRAEEGCDGYLVTEDLEVPNTFVIVELWSDLDALYTHLRNQFERIMAALGDAFAEPPEASIHEIATTRTLADGLEAAGIGR